MEYFILYFMLSYALVVIAILALWKRSVEPRKAKGLYTTRYKTLYGCGVLALCLLPLLPYAIVEWRTFRYGNALMPAVIDALKEIGEPGEKITSYKILSITNKYARVYVVTPCHSDWYGDGFVSTQIDLVKTPNGWRFQGQWTTPWSDCGNADGNVFPPYCGRGDYKH